MVALAAAVGLKLYWDGIIIAGIYSATELARAKMDRDAAKLTADATEEVARIQGAYELKKAKLELKPKKRKKK